MKNYTRSFYTSNTHVFVHAIYEPDNDDESHKGVYHAAVDMHEPGESYHVWFVVNDDNGITVDTIERWFMG